MTLKQQIAADAAVFFNAGEFAESATYNGTSIEVIPEIGQTLQPGNTVDSDGTSARALFWVKAADVAAPDSGDMIVHDGKEWQVVRIAESDGTVHYLECIGDVSPYRLGR